MYLKSIVAEHYQNKINAAAVAARAILFPDEGWIRTARKALGMSGADLARRLGKTRALVSQTEKAEQQGGVTLKLMQNMASAMGCKFVYAIVPDHDVDEILKQRAYLIARQVVERSGQHMALESQALSAERSEAEVHRIAEDLLRDMPSDFWNDQRMGVIRGGVNNDRT